MDEVRPKFKHQLIANLHQSSNRDNYLLHTFKMLQSIVKDIGYVGRICFLSMTIICSLLRRTNCDVVRYVRTRLRFALLRTTLIALRGYRGKKVDNKHETPLSEVFYNLIPAPMMEKIMFFKILCIYFFPV